MFFTFFRLLEGILDTILIKWEDSEIMFSKVYSEKYWSFGIFHLRNLWAEQCGKLRLAGTALGFHILISTAKTRKSLSVEERKKEKRNKTFPM